MPDTVASRGVTYLRPAPCLKAEPEASSPFRESFLLGPAGRVHWGGFWGLRRNGVCRPSVEDVWRGLRGRGMGTASGPSTWAVTLRSQNSCLSLREPSPGHIHACALIGGSFRAGYSSTGLPDDTVWPAFPPYWVGFSGPVVTPPPLLRYWLAARVTNEWLQR